MAEVRIQPSIRSQIRPLPDPPDRKNRSALALARRAEILRIAELCQQASVPLPSHGDFSLAWNADIKGIGMHLMWLRRAGLLKTERHLRGLIVVHVGSLRDYLAEREKEKNP